MMRATMQRLQPFALIAVPVLLVLLAAFQPPSTVLLSVVVVVLAIIPFFADFEMAHLRARDLMPIVVMTAIAVAGRLIFAPLPAVSPVAAIVIVTAMAFGRGTGFLTGALVMLVGNIFFGQGPWTPWQMYCMGLVGYLAGTLAQRGLLKTDGWFIYVFGFVSIYLYGFILDTWTLIGFVSELTPATIALTYSGGAIYNLGHALSTAVFLVPIAKAWPTKFERVKRKYGIGAVTLDDR